MALGKRVFCSELQQHFSDAGTGEGGQGGHWTPQCLADQLTLFQMGEGILSPSITTGPLIFFHLPASLLSWQGGCMVNLWFSDFHSTYGLKKKSASMIINLLCKYLSK